MRARLVLENMNFERGIDPKEAMSIGNSEARAKVQIEKALSELVNEFGKESKFKIVKDLSWDAIKGYFYYDPSDEKRKYLPIIFIIVYFPDSNHMMVYPAKRWHLARRNKKEDYFPEIKTDVKNAEEGRQKIRGWISQNPKDTFDIKESLNFERGMDPKDSMQLGHYKERIIDRKKEELSSALSSIFSIKQFYKPEIMTQAQETPGADYEFQVQARVEYKGYWFTLDYRGNFSSKEFELYSAIVAQKNRGPSDQRNYNKLELAIEQLKRWITSAID